MEQEKLTKDFEEVYEEKNIFGKSKYYTNFKYTNKKGESEGVVLRIDKKTYLRGISKK